MSTPLRVIMLVAASSVVNMSHATDPRQPGRCHLYVAPTGSDLNPGTRSEPFQTIQHGASLATPGTTVHVAPGIYMENVTTRAHGTAMARIRYVSDTKWGARVIGSGTEFMWTNRGNYTDIVGFDITGSGRQGILNLASHTLIQGNHVHHLAISGGCTGGGGAGINNGDYNGSDGDIIGNVVHDIGVPGKCSGVHGIYVANLRAKVYDNIVYRASSWGIHLWHAADEVLVANNTVFQNGSESMGGGIVMGVGDSPGGRILTGTRVINNIVYDNRYRGIMQFCYPGQACIGSGNVVANNVVTGSATGIIMQVGRATGTITADPRFVNYKADGSGDYRLQRTSPAADKGAQAPPQLSISTTSALHAAPRGTSGRTSPAEKAIGSARPLRQPTAPPERVVRNTTQAHGATPCSDIGDAPKRRHRDQNGLAKKY